ncbi:MAG: hypothetical protein ACI4II_02015 [Acutalibacteraceae bacterium]
MKSLKKEHFCYGAVLSAIIEYNPDTSLVLLESQNNSRKVFKIQTNTSQECIIFFKYAFEKSEGSQSWVYQFSEQDKEYLNEWHKKKIPVFIYLLCGVKDLINSEIAVLSYDEYAEVAHKKNFTVGVKKNYPKFYLHRTKSPKDDITIPRNRIEKPFDDLIKDIVEISHGYYCPKCGTVINF